MGEEKKRESSREKANGIHERFKRNRSAISLFSLSFRKRAESFDALNRAWRRQKSSLKQTDREREREIQHYTNTNRHFKSQYYR